MASHEQMDKKAQSSDTATREELDPREQRIHDISGRCKKFKKFISVNPYCTGEDKDIETLDFLWEWHLRMCADCRARYREYQKSK